MGPYIVYILIKGLKYGDSHSYSKQLALVVLCQLSMLLNNHLGMFLLARSWRDIPLHHAVIHFHCCTASTSQSSSASARGAAALNLPVTSDVT